MIPQNKKLIYAFLKRSSTEKSVECTIKVHITQIALQTWNLEIKRARLSEPFLPYFPAAIYSPTQLPAQYHRRWGA